MARVWWVLLVLLSCAPQSPTASRGYLMGFQSFPSRPDVKTAVRDLEFWTRRADAAIFHISLPWKALLEGQTPQQLLLAQQLPLVRYYQQKGLRLVVTLDITDGLNRSAEAPELLEANRSLSELAVQNLYRQYAVAVAQLIHPDYLGLAAETNLVRLAAPKLYAAVVTAANAAAADVARAAPDVRRFISLQVETAWGRLQGGNDYIGAEQDFKDFPFMQAVGLSAYPYLAHFAAPEEIPLEYYSRVLGAHPLPALLVEGGWSSASGNGFRSSLELQARYLQRMAELASQAKLLAVFQLQFADLDVKAWFPSGQPPANLEPFLHLGLTDSDLNPKPALAVWDALFLRSRR